MKRWIIVFVAPIILSIVFSFFKTAKPINTAIMLTIGIILPIVLITSINSWNKHKKENEIN